MSAAAIELSGVRKRYRFFALDDVSLRLERGQIMGFVGPNGAGKTTTIRLLMAMIGQRRGRDPRARLPRCRRAGPREAGRRLRLRRHEPVRRRDARLAHGLREVDLPGLGRPLRRALLKRFHLRPEQRIKGLSHGERRQGGAAARARAPAAAAGARRADVGPRSRRAPRGARRVHGRARRTTSARSCSRRTTRSTSSRSPTRSRSSIAAASSTRTTRRCSSTAGGGCRLELPGHVELHEPPGVVGGRAQRPAWRWSRSNAYSAGAARGVRAGRRQRPRGPAHDARGDLRRAA